MKKELMQIYNNLLKKHGYQGWWPIKGVYKPEDYNIKNEEERFEICAGAILTQNTTWKNVEKVLEILRDKKMLNPKKILNISKKELAETIKSCGYFNQKARKLQELCRFYLDKKFGNLNDITRDDLLNVWGIGKETADSILLYAFNKPYFVVDNYTMKLFSKLLNINFKDYDSWQEFFHYNLPLNYKLFNEFHALIVAEGKI